MTIRRIAYALSLALLIMFSVAIIPGFLGPSLFFHPDSYDYAYGAVALMHGGYTVMWDGPARPPIYPPGLSLLLLPFVSFGGISASIWSVYLLALVVAVLTAFVSHRLGGFLAVPLSLFLALFTGASLHLSRAVMSDLPLAAFLLAQIAILIQPRRGRTALIAGLLGGSFVWLRLSALPLSLAGLFALSGQPKWKEHSVLYMLGAACPLVLIGVFQWATLGSPFETGYTSLALRLSAAHQNTQWFSLSYLLGSPPASDGRNLGGMISEMRLPNAVAYLMQLWGVDGFVSMSGVGLLGIAMCLLVLRRPDELGMFARFSIATVAITLVTFLPYSYQSGRFLYAPGLVLSIAAAIVVSGILLHRAASLTGGFDSGEVAGMIVNHPRQD